MEIKLRKIEPQDFPRLIALFDEFSKFEKMPDKMTNTVTQMNDEKGYIEGFVALNSDNLVIGYATCFFAYYTWTGKSMYMDDLYVQELYRGKGIGKSLINAVIEYAKTTNCKKLKWQVSEWNHPAIEFYKTLGASIHDVESNCELQL